MRHISTPLGVELWALGDETLLTEPCVAVVGSRRCSPEGERLAPEIGARLAAAGIVVVSGLAHGIDAAAHRGALSATGRTIAVLPCGLDRVYPPGHAFLALGIQRHGLLVSRYEPGTPPSRHRLLSRNRLIVDLARAVIAIEPRPRSGTASTIRAALRAGKPVWTAYPSSG